MKNTTLFLFMLVLCFNSYGQNKTSNSIKRNYYRDGVVSIEQHYDNKRSLDSIKTYYRSGTINEIFYYNTKGKFDGDCLQYNMLGEKLTTWTFKNGKLINRIDHKIEFNEKNKSKIEKAFTILNNINDDTKYNPNAINQIATRAKARYRIGNKTLALNDFLNIEKRFQKNKIPSKTRSYIYDNIGSIYASLEMDNKALHYRSKAVKTSPDDIRLLYNLGANLYEVKAFRLSIHYLNEVKKTWKNHAFSNWVLAAMYSDLDENDIALNFVNKAFEKEENIIKYSSNKSENDLRTIRGLLYHKLGDSEKGIVDLKEALRINENNSLAMRNLGVIYYDLGQFDKSCSQFEKANQLGYEKNHDKNDLQFYIAKSCHKEKNLTIEKPSEQPYVYPNPVKDILNVKNLNQENFEFELYDFESELIKKGISNGFEINISTLNPGLYILKIFDKGALHTIKIIKE